MGKEGLCRLVNERASESRGSACLLIVYLRDFVFSLLIPVLSPSCLKLLCDAPALPFALSGFFLPSFGGSAALDKCLACLIKTKGQAVRLVTLGYKFPLRSRSRVQYLAHSTPSLFPLNSEPLLESHTATS